MNKQAPIRGINSLVPNTQTCKMGNSAGQIFASSGDYKVTFELGLVTGPDKQE